MANSISTSGLNSGTVSTEHQSGQTVHDWVTDHCASVDGDGPGGNKLTTEWMSAGGKESVETDRKQGEDDETFLQRHEAAFLLEMLDAPPVA
jgi:hypothetical protein